MSTDLEHNTSGTPIENPCSRPIKQTNDRRSKPPRGLYKYKYYMYVYVYVYVYV